MTSTFKLIMFLPLIMLIVLLIAFCGATILCAEKVGQWAADRLSWIDNKLHY